MSLNPPDCTPSSSVNVAIIGAGPAGLMAAGQLAGKGYQVDVYDAMPSVARKFLLAGIGGMNITHSEDYPLFVSRYREAASQLRPMLDDFGPQALRNWIHELGIETFVGTSGRVFPKDMKAAPLLRAWLHRLRAQGVNFHPRHRWTGLNKDEHGLIWQLTNPTETISIRPQAVVLALGGASWPRLGSDGQWSSLLSQYGVAFEPFKATNCGFEIPWSDFIKERFAGTPIKHAGLSINTLSGESESKTGEFIVSNYGVEGSLVYALSAPLRDVMLNKPDAARLKLDWLPHSSPEQITAKLSQPRKGMSFSNVLRKKLNLPAITNALLKECHPELDLNDHAAVAHAIKHMQFPAVTATRPIDEVISCAGGVRFDAVNDKLMLKELPGVFVAGEMLDWEAPTGGYLLTACFATGKWAGNAAAAFVEKSDV